MSIVFKHSLIAIEDQSTEHLPIVRGLRQRDTDPHATIPTMSLPKREWGTPYYVRKTYPDPRILVIEALDFCRLRHHGHVASRVYLPQHLFVPLYYSYGQQRVTYHDQEVAILGDPRLALNIVWCVGEEEGRTI